MKETGKLVTADHQVTCDTVNTLTFVY